MFKTVFYSGAAALAALTSSGAAQAAQIVLNASSVVGSTGGFNASFAPGAIVNQQIGDVVERFGDGSTWLNPDGRDPAFITLDLGAAYQIGSFDLFNSRNLGDRATGGFQILAANTLTAASQAYATGFTLGADAVTLVAGTLTMPGATNIPITAQSFASSDWSTAYRYIQFRPLTPVSPAYGGKNFGLVELRAFDAEGMAGAVPEPGTWALLILGFGAVGAAMRRRTAAAVTQRGRLAFA